MLDDARTPAGAAAAWCSSKATLLAGDEAFVISWAEAMQRGSGCAAASGRLIWTRRSRRCAADRRRDPRVHEWHDRTTQGGHGDTRESDRGDQRPGTDRRPRRRTTGSSATCRSRTSSNASTARCVCTARATRSGSRHHSPRCPREIRDLRPTCFVGVPRVWEKMATTIADAIDALPSTRRRMARWAIGVGEQRGRSRSARRAVRRVRSGCVTGSRIASCFGTYASRPVSIRRTR